MQLSNEDAVTELLVNREVLKYSENPEIHENYIPVSNPSYDLSDYIKNTKPEPSRFGNKYIFVK